MRGGGKMEGEELKGWRWRREGKKGEALKDKERRKRRKERARGRKGRRSEGAGKEEGRKDGGRQRKSPPGEEQPAGPNPSQTGGGRDRGIQTGPGVL